MVTIEFERVSFEYVDRHGAVVKALDQIALNIPAGQFTAVIGHNGSGKSTLAKHINALLRPTAGSVRVGRLDTNDEANLWRIRGSVGFVFQSPDNQIVGSTVEEDVAFGPENLGVPTAEIRRRVDEALGAVGMGGFATRAPHLLSGGQKQRVAIAGCLAMRPSCLVLDEPTSMLDPAGRADLLATVTRLWKELGVTVVLITHFMEEAALAERVVVMHKGALIADGAPATVFEQEQLLTEVRLAVPVPTKVAWLLRAQGHDVPRGITSVAGLVDGVCR